MDLALLRQVLAIQRHRVAAVAQSLQFPQHTPLLRHHVPIQVAIHSIHPLHSHPFWLSIRTCHSLSPAHASCKMNMRAVAAATGLPYLGEPMCFAACTGIAATRSEPCCRWANTPYIQALPQNTQSLHVAAAVINMYADRTKAWLCTMACHAVAAACASAS